MKDKRDGLLARLRLPRWLKSVRARLLLSICFLAFTACVFLYSLTRLIAAPDWMGALVYAYVVGFSLIGGYSVCQSIATYWPYRANQYMPDEAEKLGLCPRCNYSMRGWSTPKCPECGMALGVSENEIKRYDA